MAKTKGKKNIAASIVPAMVEAVSGNDMIAESAPSESVENVEAAMTLVLDKPEELHKKEEETKDGPDEAEKVDENDETKDGSDEFREVDKKEETKTGTDEAEKVDENEEAKDGSNESREVDKNDETETGADESEEEETEDCPVEPEEDKTDDRSDESEEEETEDHPVESEDGKAEESEDIDEMEESEDGLNNSEDEDGKEETENAVVESEEGEKDAKQDENAVPMGTDVPEGKKLNKRVVMGTDVPEGEKVEEGAAIKDVKDLGKEENAPKKKVKRIRKGKKKVASNDADKLSGADKQGAAAAVKKDMKKADGMGLIFMCNAKTKMDCFRYKVFGLPASKKEMVAKIYKGMRLFLFDVDLKLLYGIYKAAAPGGYNIEPKAFKSGFPSQVRFDVLSDCLPLPEEKFKAAIKGNYYGRNKFNCQLSSEQVKDLCKLFQSAGKTINKKRPREVVRTEPAQISFSQGQKKARRERVRRDDIIPRGRDSYSRREAYPSPPPRSRDLAPRSRDVRAEPGRTSSYQRQKRSIRERVRRDDRIPRGPDPYARIEVYSSPPRALVLPPPPLPQAPYAYGRSVDDYYYRREAPLLDPRDRRAVDLEIRPVEPLGYRDPYSLYGEPLSREAGYREPMLREAGYRVPLSREAGYMEPLSREAGYIEPLSREAGYREPWSREAVPTLYYRY